MSITDLSNTLKLVGVQTWYFYFDLQLSHLCEDEPFFSVTFKLLPVQSIFIQLKLHSQRVPHFLSPSSCHRTHGLKPIERKRWGPHLSLSISVTWVRVGGWGNCVLFKGYCHGFHLTILTIHSLSMATIQSLALLGAQCMFTSRHIVFLREDSSHHGILGIGNLIQLNGFQSLYSVRFSSPLILANRYISWNFVSCLLIQW